MLIAVSDTPANERGPRHTKPILSAIHKATCRSESVSFLFASHEEAAGLYVRFPNRLTSLVKGQFHAKYPDCDIESLSEDALDTPSGHEVWSLTLRLRPELFPIVRYQQYEDAVQAILGMQNPTEGRRVLAASYAQLGRIEEAIAHG